MSRLLIVVPLLFSSMLTINSQRAEMEVDYDIQNEITGKVRRTIVASPLVFTCHTGDKYLIRPVNQILQIESLKKEEEELQPLCSFAHPSNPAICVLYQQAEQSCTLYFDSRTSLIVPMRKGTVLMKNLTPLPVMEKFFELHLDKVRVAKSFQVKYQVGTFPDGKGRFGKVGRFLGNSKWYFKDETNSHFDFTCGPTRPVEIDCSSMDCNSLHVASTHMPYIPHSSRILAYVVRNKATYHLKPAQIGGDLSMAHFCIIYVANKFEVGLPRMALKRHINILFSRSKTKRGFRVLWRSLKVS